MPPIADLEVIRKAQIIDAALRAISERGYANVTMDDFCKAAGISKGGLTHYYKSKDDLFKAAFQEFFRRIFLRGDETMSAFEDPMDQVLSFEWLYSTQDPDSKTAYPILFDFMSMAVRDQGYREIFKDWVDNWVDLVRKAILRGQSQGRFLNVDVECASRTISAIYHGVATRWYLAPEEHSTQWAIEGTRRSIKSILDSYENTITHKKRSTTVSKTRK